MGKLIMARIEINEEEMEMRISDIQRIERVPEAVKNVIRNNVQGRRRTKEGLPSVTYLGPNRTMVIGAFNYGEISFLEVEGRWKNIADGDELICITAYREDASYEELKEGKEEYISQLKKKYPKGMKVK